MADLMADLAITAFGQLNGLREKTGPGVCCLQYGSSTSPFEVSLICCLNWLYQDWSFEERVEIYAVG